MTYACKKLCERSLSLVDFGTNSPMGFFGPDSSRTQKAESRSRKKQDSENAEGDGYITRPFCFCVSFMSKTHIFKARRILRRVSASFSSGFHHKHGVITIDQDVEKVVL